MRPTLHFRAKKGRCSGCSGCQSNKSCCSFFTLILTRWLKATEPQKLSINFLKLPGKDWRLFFQIGYPNKIQTKEKWLVKVTLFLSFKCLCLCPPPSCKQALNPASHENSSPWICMQILPKAASL